MLETAARLTVSTRSVPAALELLQHLVAYCLAIALEQLPDECYPRQETARCIKLALFCTPWDRRHLSCYLCHLRGEVFFLDGDLTPGSCEDYLEAIRQVEGCLPREDLRWYLMDRTAEPCFEFELAKAARIWGAIPYRGRTVIE